MSLKREESDPAQRVSYDAERRMLEKAYRDQMHVSDRQDATMCVHLGHLRDRLATLSGLRIIQAAPVSVETLRLQTQFICSDICVNAVAGLLATDGKVVDESELFLTLWKDFSELHCLIWKDAKEQAIDTAIHTLFFGAAALYVIANCRSEGFELEPEWIPLARTLVPGARFDGSANEELVRILTIRIQNEIEKM